jgi:hypothetical protein
VLLLPLEVLASDEMSVPERVFRDVDSEPLPFETDGEAEAFLLSAQVTAQRDIGTGVTKPKQLVLEKDGLKVHAAFNYVDTEGDNKKLADGTTEMYFIDSYRSDIATYRLSRMLGLEMIPPGVERQIDGVDGVVRLWIEDLESYQDWIDAGNSGTPDSLYIQRQLRDQIAFDLLIRNTDRNQSNINWDPDNNLWMIDQTRSLGRDPSLRASEKKKFKGCSRTFYEGAKALKKGDIERELSPYMSSFQIKALLKRRDALVKLIDSAIKKKGEDEILFNYTDPPKGFVIRYDDG